MLLRNKDMSKPLECGHIMRDEKMNTEIKKTTMATIRVVFLYL